MVKFVLTEQEYADFRAAAERLGLAQGAYAAVASLAAARMANPPMPDPLRKALIELMQASGQVRRIGVNLNQAVAALNATGADPGNLLPYAFAGAASRSRAAAPYAPRRPVGEAAKSGSRDSPSADMIDSVASSGDTDMRLDLDGRLIGTCVAKSCGSRCPHVNNILDRHDPDFRQAVDLPAVRNAITDQRGVGQETISRA
ncbi:hypothetical protein Psi02_70340 [Planotetraspora silvatica]|uniref:Uncharacterized protein n=1 Tax=Planotetraspora silvatica TaxID=234614 RepID=A0A8J3V5X7_9ACTN|nr:hypothetical protein [Planotetraspora silvatica]GII50610.1 hypothetical protein Psi02_70340 [Planotetraspora silvatica]